MEYLEEQEEVARTRLPKKGEVLGVVLEMLGAGKLKVNCEDGFNRICRIPGKIRKRVWIHTGNVVLIKPWKVQSNERADVIWQYTPTQASWLRKKGYLKRLQT